MKSRFARMLALFFLSGFSALVFEVVWAKQACLVFGNTTLASAAVIAAFMTGLAFGSHYFGRFSIQSPGRALRLYGNLEGIVASFAVCFPLLTIVLNPLYQMLYAHLYQDFFTLSILRFILAFFVLGVPTVCMGASLPLLARFLSGTGQATADRIGFLYTVNLLGAAAGALVSGFFLIEKLGFYTTSLVAACLNLAIFAVIRFRPDWLGDRAGTTVSSDTSEAAAAYAQPAESADSAILKNEKRLLFFILAAHGFCAFVIQIVWNRIMAMVLGSSTYSFSAVLTTFLAGLAIGAFWIGRRSKKGRVYSLPDIGRLQITMGVALLLFIPTFEWLIYAYIRYFPLISRSGTSVHVAQFFFCAVSMLIPAVMIGRIFPACLAYANRSKDLSRAIGTAYAVNTAGSVLGAFLTAFVLISHLGLNRSLHAAAFLSMAAGWIVIALLPAASKPGARPKGLVRRTYKPAFVILLSWIFLVSPWDPNMFSSGPFIYASSWSNTARMGQRALKKAMNAGQSLIYYKEGISSTVSVLQYDVQNQRTGMTAKSVRVNGKTDASTIGDMGTQLFLGYIPLFAHPNPKDVLIIGLGSGSTVGTAAHFDSVQKIRCVEIEPAMVEANRFFSNENNFALKDPRVQVIIGDGRNHVAFSPEKYDVIISEPSNPWVAGVSTLFAKETYQAGLRRLNPDGLYCQWIHAYQMSKTDFLMLIKTFSSVFPNVNLFRINSGDYFLLGGKAPIRFDYGRMMDLVRTSPFIQSDIKFFSPAGLQFLNNLFVLSDRDIRAALAKEKIPLNTDDRLLLEFNAPKYLYANTSEEITDWLYTLPRKDILPSLTNLDRAAVLKTEDMWGFYYRQAINTLAASNYSDALRFAKMSLRRKPDESKTRYLLAQIYEQMGSYSRAMALYKKFEGTPLWESVVKKTYQRARLKQLVKQNPFLNRNVNYHNILANLNFDLGDYREAYVEMDRAISANPSFVKNYTDLAMFAVAKRDTPAMLAFAKKAAATDPNSPWTKKIQQVIASVLGKEKELLLLTEGRDLMAAKSYRRAKANFETILANNPYNFVAVHFLAESEKALGENEAAARHAALAADLLKKYQQEQAQTTEPKAAGSPATAPAAVPSAKSTDSPASKNQTK